MGEPAGALFDAAARDDQHGYFDRSLREVGHGSSRAASGGPSPIGNAKVRGVDNSGFLSCYTLCAVKVVNYSREGGVVLKVQTNYSRQRGGLY